MKCHAVVTPQWYERDGAVTCRFNSVWSVHGLPLCKRHAKLALEAKDWFLVGDRLLCIPATFKKRERELKAQIYALTKANERLTEKLESVRKALKP